MLKIDMIASCDIFAAFLVMNASKLLKMLTLRCWLWNSWCSLLFWSMVKNVKVVKISISYRLFMDLSRLMCEPAYSEFCIIFANKLAYFSVFFINYKVEFCSS